MIQNNSKKILMIIAQQNYRDEEYDIPKNFFTQAGFMVVTASQNVGKAVGKLGGSTQATFSISDVDVKNYDAIVFVGGSGSALFQHNATVHAIAREAVKQQKILASICLAGAILAYAGVLKGKKATVWNKDGKQQPIFEEHGATYIPKSVVVDGRIITADGPAAAEQFAEKIIETLGKK